MTKTTAKWKTYSYSEISTFKRCPQKYYFRYSAKIEPIEKGIGLIKGDLIHRVLARCNNERDAHRAWVETELAKATKEYRLEDDDRWDEFCKFLPWFAETYPGWFANNFPEVYETMPEYSAKARIPHTNAYIWVKPDLVVIDKGKAWWITEYKTMTQRKETTPLQLKLDDQLSTYCWGLRTLHNVTATGICYIKILTKKPEAPKVLASGKLSKDKNQATTYEMYVKAIKKHNLDPTDYNDMLLYLLDNPDLWFIKKETTYRTREELNSVGEELKLEVSAIRYANRNGLYYRSPRDDCKWDCDYVDLCTSLYKGIDIDQMIEGAYQPRQYR